MGNYGGARTQPPSPELPIAQKENHHPVRSQPHAPPHNLPALLDEDQGTGCRSREEDQLPTVRHAAAAAAGKKINCP
jgi:hypothetical protein